MKYAEIILPLPLANSYTYSIPSEMEKAVQPGCRVIVHFGKRKYYTGIISEIHDRSPQEGFEIKQIHALLDAAPVLRRPQLRFWSWISSYYLCKQGDVYKAALPSGLKLESETTISLNESFTADTPLRLNEQAVLDAFDKDQNKLTISQLEKKTGLRNVVQLLSSLMSRGAVVISEELKKGFTPKTELFVELNPVYQQEDLLQQIFDELKRAKKQEYLLVTYLELSHALNPLLVKEISKKELLDYSQCSSSILDQLVKRGILHYKEKEIGRLKHVVSRIREPEQLSEAQLKAYDEIYDRFKTKEVCLLHGVTSSGKTELYIHLIRDVLAQGRQVLYLLPEIAITTQITERLSKYFGDKLFVYHSKFPDNERVEIWNRLLYSNEPLVVLGVRSSLFLPFKDLGLIIVDEEHENTYKQQDPAPRYHARNAAIVLAGMHGGKTLLGSATPSVDSYFNAQTGKYGWVELTTRYGDGLLPETLIVDIKELRRKKIMKEGPFSPVLLEKMKSAVSRHEQVILFQNRRGFASVIECRNCGWVPHCVNCDVSLTYHKSKNELICHYCGYNILLPPCCPECQHKELKLLGFGTQKIEEEIATTFPEFTVGRLDIDTARTRSSYERIIADFEKGKTNIMIGTQMISKGLDFGNVSLVGIMNADSLMNYPDFRAHERAFQLMVQVSGRAGRRDKRGLVVLQTSQPDHPLLRMIQQVSYKEMANLQLSERSQFRYPPYYRMINIVLRSKNETLLQEMAGVYADHLRKRLGDRVLGPVLPVITRIQSLSIRIIVLKIEITAGIKPVREILEQVHGEMQRYLPFKQLIMHYDVDPV